MAIDQRIWERDLRNNIADNPVTIRHKSRTITVSCQSTVQLSQVIDNGVLDDTSLIFIGVRSDFGSTPPENRDIVELKMRNGRWLELEVSSTPDRNDPTSPQVTFIVGSVDK